MSDTYCKKSESILCRRGQPTDGYRYPEKTFYHLSLDKLLDYLSVDVRKQRIFAEVLESPLIDVNDIYFRQSVLRDFENNTELMQELHSLFVRFVELAEGNKAVQHERFRVGLKGHDSIDSVRNLLQSNSLTLKRALLFIKEIEEVLSRFEIESEGLQIILSSCSEYTAEPALSEMISFCGSFEYFSPSTLVDIALTIDSDGKIDGASLISHEHVNITDPDLKPSGFSRLFRKNEPRHPCERIYPSTSDNYGELIIAAINELCVLFERLSGELFSRFLPIARELEFYEVALKYISRTRELGLPLCYPELHNGRELEVRRLYDLYLTYSRRECRTVVPNDLTVAKDGKGILLFGANGSGKTVFLRSVAVMRILAQSGLPIPAESARLPIFRQLVTQFSEAEKEFTVGNDAGRFEQEVRELAAMVETLEPGAFVFLNETFQTTAYDEGSEGLFHILEYFAARQIGFIAVTHLRQLERKFAPGEVTKLRTVEGYRIEE